MNSTNTRPFAPASAKGDLTQEENSDFNQNPNHLLPPYHISVFVETVMQSLTHENQTSIELIRQIEIGKSNGKFEKFQRAAD